MITVKRNLALVALLTAVVAGPAFAAGSSASKGGYSVAMARIRSGQGVVTFGGKKTTAAFSSSSFVGSYSVTFLGTYPTNISPDKVIIQSTCQSSNYGVSNSYVISATPTEIRVGTYCWKSDTLAYLGGSSDIFLNVFVGQ